MLSNKSFTETFSKLVLFVEISVLALTIFVQSSTIPLRGIVEDLMNSYPH